MANTAEIIKFPTLEEDIKIDKPRDYVKADLDDGYDRLPHQIIGLLENPQQKLSGREYQVIFAVIAKTYRWHEQSELIRNTELSEITGISTQHVSELKKSLINKGILTLTGRYIGFEAELNAGYVRLAQTITDALAKPSARVSAREYQIILAVIAKTYRWHKKTDWINNVQLSDRTGIAQSHISELKKSLINKSILLTEGRNVGVNPIVSEWGKELPKTGKFKNSQKRVKTLPKTGKDTPKNGEKSSQKWVTQKKDTLTKETITKDTCVKTEKLSVDPDQVKTLFNELLGNDLAKVQKLNANRKTLIKARSKDFTTLNHWRDYFLKIQNSDFLLGRKTNWKANFDWILKDSNSLKVLEGNYDNAPVSFQHSYPQQGFQTVGDQLAQLQAAVAHLPAVADDEVF